MATRQSTDPTPAAQARLLTPDEIAPLARLIVAAAPVAYVPPSAQLPDADDHLARLLDALARLA